MIPRFHKTIITLISALVLALLPAGAVFAGVHDEMHDAICDRDLDKVKELVGNGYNVNYYDKDHVSPLTLASYCYGGAPRIANYLLDQGADPNAHSRSNYSPIMWAMRSMDSASVEDPFRKLAMRMLNKGAEINYVAPTTKRTPLHNAARIGDTMMVRLLLEKGANRTARAAKGWDPGTPADYARLGGFVELALELENKDPREYYKTLHYAVIYGKKDQVKRLIDSGADVNEAEYRSKFTPLHYAAMHNRVEIGKMLLEAGAKPTPINYAGISPLRDAIVNYRTDMAKALIDGGARGDNAQTQGCGSGMTEWDWAVSYGVYEVAKYMVEKNALSFDAIDPFSNFWGYYEYQLELVEYLIDKGAKPTPQHIAKLKGMEQDSTRKKLIATLEKALKDPSEPEDNGPDFPDFPPAPSMSQARGGDFMKALPPTKEEQKFNKTFRKSKHEMAADIDLVPTR